MVAQLLTCGWLVSVGLVRDVTGRPPLFDRIELIVDMASGRQLFTINSIPVSSLLSVSPMVNICGSTFHPMVLPVRWREARGHRRRDDGPFDARLTVRLILSQTVASVCISANVQIERHVSVHFILPDSTVLARRRPFRDKCPILCLRSHYRDR